jgi:4,5-dihydroxyphthalate decarboxylase
MPDLKLTFACGLYDRMLPLYTGSVRPEGIDLQYIVDDDPRRIFDRMGAEQAYDLCEFSSSEHISRLSTGNTPLVALPVFASRVFRHGFIIINKRAGIRTAKDLEGKRIGVPLYTMSAALWIRGHLQHDYGVDLSTIEWVQGAVNTTGAHGSPSAPPLLKKIKIENNTSSKNLSQLLAEGEIQALIGAVQPDSLKTSPDVVRLFPNYAEVERDFYKRTKIFPIMHLIAMRRDVYEKHPFIGKSLFDAFCRAKDEALAAMRFDGTLRYMLPWLHRDLEEIDDVFGGDPWPYGVEPNRPTLTAQIAYMHEQGMIKEPIAIEKLFVPTDK